MEVSYKDKKNRSIKILFIALISIFLFWFIANKTDIYKHAVVGAIYELLWLPIVLGTLALPITAIYFWIKNKFRSTFLIIALLSITLGVWRIFFS